MTLFSDYDTLLKIKGNMKKSKCRHCGQPIRKIDSRWVHDDPDENPKDPDYGWIKCLPDKDGSYKEAEPK